MNIKVLNDLDDEEIITRIREGDSARCFGILYNRYHKKVMEKCFSFVKDSALAKELAEDVLSKTYEQLPSFRQKSAFSTWLYSITYNHCIDYLRKKKKLHYPNWNKENEIPELAYDTEEVAAEINYDQLKVILEMIHPEEKALLLMKYLDNLSIKQISKALRISDNATKKSPYARSVSL